jgi:hypothetical protein
VIDWFEDGWEDALAMLPALLAVLLTAAVLTALIRTGLGLGTDFVIKSQGRGQVTVRGRIPLGKVAGIREFFTRDLARAGPVTVRGSFGRGRALKLRFSGRLSTGQQQRARNFLVDHLR